MKEVPYSLHKPLPDTSYEQAVEKVTEALKSQGFGVLTSIDVKATLKEKIDVEHKRYVILGACNPQLAHQALSADDNIGLLLPCNVVVSETEQGSEVAVARPKAMLEIADVPGMESVADEAEARLRKVLQTV